MYIYSEREIREADHQAEQNGLDTFSFNGKCRPCPIY